MALWIVSYPSGALRSTDSDGRRTSKPLHICPRLRSVIKTNALEPNLLLREHMLPFRGFFTVLGLCKLSSSDCKVFRDSLIAWSFSAAVQRECYDDPIDAYEIHTESFHRCTEQVNVSHEFERSTRHRDGGGQARISLKHPLFKPVWPPAAGFEVLGGDNCTVPATDLLQRWGIQGRNLFDFLFYIVLYYVLLLFPFLLSHFYL